MLSDGKFMWAAFGRAEVFDLSPTGHRCSFPSPAVKVGRHATDKHDTEIYLACYRWVQYAAKRRCTDQKNELVLWPLASVRLYSDPARFEAAYVAADTDRPQALAISMSRGAHSPPSC